MIDIPKEIKKLFLNSEAKRNFRIHFPNGERKDIINDQLVYESVKFTESIFSGGELEFGIYEANMLEFQCVGIENIKGKTIEASIEIDISSMPSEFIAEHGKTSTDVSFPFYSINYGTFIIVSCPRQSDMRVRLVTAYSDFLNMENDFEEISVFERAKIEARFKANTPYSINPITFALSNISQKINLDVAQLGGFSLPITSLKSNLEAAEYYFQPFNSYNPSLGKDIGVDVIVKGYKLDLTKYKDSESFFCYKTGEKTAESAVKEIFNSLVEPYKDRITGYQTGIENKLQELIARTYPLVRLRDYNKSDDTYYSKVAYGMSDNGIFAPRFAGYEGDMYYVFFPTMLTVQIHKWVRSPIITEILEYEDIILSSDMDLNVDGTMISSSELQIPNISVSIPRGKTPKGEYVIDSSNLPSSYNSFKAFMELNGCFLRKDRKDNLYRFLQLKDLSQVYPSNKLYPSNNLYPSSAIPHLEKAFYKNVWYDEEVYGGYERIIANYTNDNGEKAFAEYYEPEYEENYTEIMSSNFVKLSESDYEEFTIDLSSYNPFQDGNLYGTANGLIIQEAKANNGGNVAFDILIDDSGTFFEQSENWSEITSITLVLNVKTIKYGGSVSLSFGIMDREEIEKSRKTLDISANYLVSNCKFTIRGMLDALEALFNAVKDIEYVPARITAVGMPWVEAGDFLMLSTMDGTIKTLVLERNLKGILDLKDSIESL